MNLTGILKQLINETIIVELKNGNTVSGVLNSTDKEMNLVLHDAKLACSGEEPTELEKLSIRGNTIYLISIPDTVDPCKLAASH